MFKHFLKTTLSLIGVFSLASSPSIAGQLGDGTVFFDKSPLLSDVSATFTTVRVWSAKYYFTIDLPANAGEPLQTVTIRQKDGLQTIDFFLDRTFAFVGTRYNRGQALTLKSTTIDPESRTISVVFDPPVPPGTTISIGLKPVRNPDYGGIYQFGVAAFPAGDKTDGLNLGVRRLDFYDAGDRW